MPVKKTKLNVEIERERALHHIVHIVHILYILAIYTLVPTGDISMTRVSPLITLS